MSADQLHEDRSGSEVDFDRASSLCHEGLHTHFAAVCVNPDGTDSLWLVDKQVLRDGDGGRRYPIPPHERTGRLPRDIRERFYDLRCGRPTSSGKPCRNRVAESGKPCGTHAKPRCVGCGQIMLNQGGVWGCFGCRPDRHWLPVEARPA